MFFHRLANRHEDDAFLFQFLLECCLYRYGIHDGVNGDAAKGEAFFEGNAEFVEGLCQFRVDVVRRLRSVRFLCHRVGIVRDCLIVNRRQCDMSPRRLFLPAPVSECVETEVKQPLRLALLCRDEPHDIFIQSDGYDFGMDVGGEPVFVFLFSHLTHKFVLFFHKGISSCVAASCVSVCRAIGADVQPYAYLSAKLLFFPDMTKK